ncbi:uncharacterized protein LOC128549350 [Mercenaria mercenaria]|uniref:uncharacterized protein LOC128549350 n=1 Tax=Mercenaria mercenaria TaxID=6596 RepID=UPI00234F8170|nr:uncharacterized protein LOC128549350 [Mercenaria mercenaria]
MGHTNVVYIDDSLLQGDTCEDCLTNVNDTLTLVEDLGFTAHTEKSVVIPTQCITFVEFLLDSVSMTIRLTPEKCRDILEHCKKLLGQKYVSIRELATIIGKLVASEPGVLYAPLYYKKLEIERDQALSKYKGDFEANITLPAESMNCLTWWINNIHTSYNPIQTSDPDVIIESDSSQFGLGGFDKTNNIKVYGHWSDSDKLRHISYLELKAAFYVLQFLCENLHDVHVQLYLDNTVAIKYLSKMGGRVPELNDLTCKIWSWCVNKSIWLSVYHIPGKDNITADKLSRSLSDDMEWALRDEVFLDICQKLNVTCDIDMIASNLTKKLPMFVSYIPEKSAYAINVFSLSWNKYSCIYMFPPFSLLAAVLQKLDREKANAVLIAPIFPTQVWFPRLLNIVLEVV